MPTLTNFTRTWFKPSNIEKIIKKEAANPSIDLLVI
jgi:hypothetical protein